MRRSISSVLASLFTGLLLVAGCGDVNHGPAPELEAPLSFYGEGHALADRFSPDPDGLGYLLEPIVADELDFDRVALMLDAEHAPTLDVRVSGDWGITWTEWLPMTITWSEDDRHNAHADVHHGGTHVQLRLRDLEPEQVSFVNLEAFVYGPEWSEYDFEDRSEPEIQTGLTTQTQALAANTGVDVTRSGWGARATRCSTRHTINRITVHHTVTPNNDSNMPSRMRQMQNYHMDSLGWCDIGYHFTIGQDGKVYQGRAETLLGTHVGNNNTNNGGISFIGTYTSVVPSSGMMNAGAKIIRAIGAHYRFTITRTSVKGHREYNSTACPGNALYPKLGDLVTLANSGGSTTPPPPTGNGTLRGAIFWGTNFDADIQDSAKRISGAAVRLNSGQTTTTDSSGNYSFSVPAGTYTITASASGYSTETLSRSVTSGNTSWGSIMLTKQTTTTKGTLRGAIYHGSDLQNLANRISGATVRLNSGQQTTTDGEGWYSFELNAGTYTVTASKSGYSTETLSRTVATGETAWGSIKLTANAAPPPPAPEPEPDPEPTPEPPPATDPDPEPNPDPPAPSDPVDPTDPIEEPSDESGVFGFVYDSLGGDLARIAGASVRIGDREVMTDATGAFDLDMVPGTHPLMVRAEGYAQFLGAVGVVTGTRIRLRIGLEPIEEELEDAIGITFPADGEFLTQRRALVLGVYDYATVGTIEVNGVVAALDENAQTFAADVDLVAGENVIEALLRDTDGRIVARSSVVVEVQGGGAFGCSTSGNSAGGGAFASLLLLGLLAACARRKTR